MDLTKVRRTFATVKYLRPGQIYHRLKFIGKRKIAYPLRVVSMNRYRGMVRRQGFALGQGYQPLLAFRFDHWEPSELLELKNRVKGIQSNTFRFLNHEHEFVGEVEWNDPRLSHLWRYNLHYFDYAIWLGAVWQSDRENLSYFQTFKSLVESWIRNHQQIGRGDAWHPYTISLRLVNWRYAYDLFKPLIDVDEPFRERFMESYGIQCLFLYDNVEWDVLGNHLIENGKALAFAGMFLEGSAYARAKKKGLRILWGQLEEQVLSDGGHYERSPMYHQIVLKDYLEVVRLLRIYRETYPDRVEEKIRQMLRFQNETLHPDGDIPLFNDSAFGIASTAASIRLLARELGLGDAEGTDKPSTVLDRLLTRTTDSALLVDRCAQSPTFAASESGYFVHRSERLFLIADAGKACPDFLPAHAHADFGSFEMSLDGMRWLVDSGVYQYQGELRNVFRGTSAHNCLMINGKDQSEVWGSFRLADRAQPIFVEYTEQADLWALSAAHNGYAKERVAPVRKIIVLSWGAVIVIDEIACSTPTKMESFLHFHPEITVRSEGHGYNTAREGRHLFVQTVGSNEYVTHVTKGMYSDQFGMSRDNVVIVTSSEVPSGTSVFAYVLSYEQCAVNLETQGEGYCLQVGNYRLEIRLGPSLEVALQNKKGGGDS